MTTPPDPLSSEARALLDDVRPAHEPAASDRKRVKQAILATIAAGATASATTTTAGATAATGGTGSLGATALGTSGLFKVGVGVVALTVATGAAVLMRDVVFDSPHPGNPARPQAQTSAAHVPPEGGEAAGARAAAPGEEGQGPREPSGDQITPAVDNADQIAVPPERTVRRRPQPPLNDQPRATTEPGPPSPATPDTLVEETALLARANAALARGDHAHVLILTHQFRQRYPNGTMRVEAEGARVTALCELDDPRAQRAAAAFISAHPRSTMIGRIRNACDR